MPSPQDPSNPLRSVFSTIKNRVAPEKKPKRNWEEHTGELLGDAYPELNMRNGKAAETPQAQAEAGATEEQLRDLIEDGGLRALSPNQLSPVFVSLLNAGSLELFIQAIDRVRNGLESTAPDDRRWALESVKALITLPDLSLIPYGTLPLLLDCVGRLLVKEERVELRDAALEATAHLLGIEAVQGDLDSVHAHLAWLERTARARGPEYSLRVLSSHLIVQPVLELFFEEGHSALEDRVLPFFRFLGEPGTRTLMQMLEQEHSRPHRKRILELLKLLGSLSIPALKEGLVAGSWHLVRNALNLVGDLEEAQAFEYIVPCLEHPDQRVVRAAVRALWKTGAARAGKYLLEMLPKSEGEPRLEILLGLGRIGSVEAIPAIGAMIASAPEEHKIAAIEALGLIKHAAAIPILETCLKRKGRIFKTAEALSVRLAAAKALLTMGTQDARRILDQVIAEEPKGQDLEALKKTAGALNAWG
jgi:HEAT repeat protein